MPPQNLTINCILPIPKSLRNNLDRDAKLCRHDSPLGRFLSDSGREARFPYLDEGVVSYLATLPLSSVADLTMPPGEVGLHLSPAILHERSDESILDSVDGSAMPHG